MTSLSQLSPGYRPTPAAPAARTLVVALVLSAHLALWSVWSQQPGASAIAAQELTVSFAMLAHAPQPAMAQAQPVIRMPLPDKVVLAETAPAVAAVVAVVAAAQPAPAEPAAPAATVSADVEPDYQASYLNNIPPAYPLLARRMGLQGKVVLNVEVLAAGVCGEIRIHRSSGHAMLDHAALQAVKSWHFMPARQAGHSVDKWFMIPINFSLKDQAA